MSTKTLVSEDEYLHTSYEPESEYADGVRVERNVGTRDHSKLQMALSAYLYSRRKEWNIHVYPEQRIKLRPGRYAVPDICVVQGPEPEEQIFTKPPLLWIEILSPEDRLIRVSQKVKEVLAFGVPYVWIIDPESLDSELHTQSGSEILEHGILQIPDTRINVPLKQVLD